MEPSGRDWSKIFLWAVLLVLTANVLMLDVVIGRSLKEEGIGRRVDTLEELLTQFSRDLLRQNEPASLSAEPSAGTALLPTPTPRVVERETVIEKVVTQPASSQVKEFYVPLGQGSARTENFNWQDTGAEATLDLGNYPGVKEVKFEATLSVESGQVEARLYNVSDGYGLVESTLVAHGPTPKLYRSGNLILPGGNKTYRVQMRTSLPYTAALDSARIRITVD